MTIPQVVTEKLLPPVTRRRPSEALRRQLPASLRSDRAVVAALTLLALLLRIPNLGRAYWIDEGISIGIASHPVDQLPRLLRRDGSPPLFYFVLHFWIRVFGRSEVSTHLLPLAVSLVAVAVGYWAGRELFDRRAGLAAAALLATNPFLNWYATETRMYTLVVVLSMLGVTFAWRAARQRRLGDAAAAVASFAALMYTHDWGIYLLGATGAALLLMARADRDRALAAGVILGGAATVVLWLPWLPTFAYQAGNTAAPWAVRPAIGDFFADPATALGGTLGFLVVPALALGGWRYRRHAGDEHRRAAGWAAGIAAIATVAGFVGAQVEPSWTVRYLAIIVGPYLLAAAGILVCSRPGRSVLWAVCVILSLWAVVGFLLPNPNRRYAKDNMAAVAADAAALLGPGDVVVVTQTEQVPVAYHYLPPGLRYLTPTGPVADPGVVDWRDIVHRLNAATPCQALSPVLDSLPVGAEVLEIDPVRRLGATGSAWSRAVNSQVSQVGAFLTNDPALKQIDVYTPALRPKPYAPVDGILFEKTARTPSCA